MVQLEDLFEQLLPNLPTEEETTLTFNAGNCICPEDELETPRLKVVPWPLGHSYGDSSRYDLIHFFADKATYQRLGLLLFAAVFHNRAITLHLRHPETKVTKIRIGGEIDDPAYSQIFGLMQTPVAYGYSPAPPMHLHPLWREEGRIDRSYPIFGVRRVNLPFLVHKRGWQVRR